MHQVEVRSGGAKFKQDIKTQSHSLTADAPQEFGGGDTAPNPHELLLASLGSCTAITMQMYAGRKGWKLDEVLVAVTLNDVQDPKNEGATVTQFNRDIKIKGELSDEEVESLKKIADKCPIHKLLAGSKTITTSIDRVK